MANGKRFSLIDLSRFFVDSLLSGVKDHIRMFLGACGFIMALGVVFAASNFAPAMFHKPAPVAIDERAGFPEPNHENLNPKRNLASVTAKPSQRVAVSAGQSSGSLNSDFGANTNNGDVPQANPAVTASANSSSEASRASGTGVGSSYSSSGASTGGSTGSAEKSPNSNTESSPGIASGGVAQGTLPSTASTNSAGGPSSGAAVSGVRVAAVSGYLVTAGGGVGTGTNLRVQASVGEVVSNNYTSTPQFVLISGVAGVLFSQ